MGYFNYHNIPYSYINFNIFQYFMNGFWVFIVTSSMLISLSFILFNISKQAIKSRKELKDGHYSIKVKRKTSKYLIGYILQSLAVMIYVSIFLYSYYHYNGFPKLFFVLLIGFIVLIPVFYILIFKKFYAAALLIVSVLFLITCYVSGYINGANSNLDFACIDKDEYVVVDYFEDKFILKKVNEEQYFEVRNLNSSSLRVFDTLDSTEVSCTSDD